MMSIPLTVTDVLRDHVTLTVESIDRMYLNVYLPQLQHAHGVVGFFRQQRGQSFVSSVLMAPISHAFTAAIQTFIQTQDVPLVTFQKGDRKDDIAAKYRAGFQGDEGILFVGKAPETATIFRTEKRHNPATGRSYPWIVRSTGRVNQFYFYGIDHDFGPFFLKFNSYFPYTAKLCLNGHEYAKRQLAQAGIAYEALDNGFLSCADPARLQAICEGLSADQIEALGRKWLARLPQPLTAEDQAAGYRYEFSILQAEFALTQVLDRPLSGRALFEDIIRENLDVGRPDQVQLIFQRRVTKRTPGQFRTRVITEGVIPSLHLDYKSSRLKQYFKEGRALRTETTINNARDFALGKRLQNLPALRAVGFTANRRLLDVQQLSHNCLIGEDTFNRLNQSIVVNGQRAAALRFADPKVQALLSLLVMFGLVAYGFRQRDFRVHLAALLGLEPQTITPGCLTYHLRRLRLHGLIERRPHTQAYQVTADGLRLALFCTRTYSRLLRPGLALISPEAIPSNSSLRRQFDKLEVAMKDWTEQAKLAV
jgi:hypothetical protein